jgi:hypothetical protein
MQYGKQSMVVRAEPQPLTLLPISALITGAPILRLLLFISFEREVSTHFSGEEIE